MREGNSISAIPQEKNASPKRGAFFSIQGRLIALILLLLVPILLIQTYFFYSRYQYRRGVELQSNLEIARAVGKTFTIFVQDVLSQELSIGITFTVHDDLTIEQMNEILKKNKAAYPVLRNFAWITPEGRVIASSLPDAIGLDVSERPYFKEITAGKDWALSDLYPSAVSGDPIFSINLAIRKEDGALLGIVFASVDITHMDDLFAFERARSGAFVILDSKGMLVYRHPAIQTTWEDRNWLRIYPSIYNEVLAGKESVTTVLVTYEGKRRMVANTPISSLGWIVGAGRGEEAVMGPIISGILKETGVLLFVAITSLLAALGLSRTISASVKTLQRHALALGRAEAAGIVSAPGPAELKDLADAFNLMAEKVQSRETALRESEERYRALINASSQVLYHMSPDWSEMQLLQGGNFIADTEKSNYNWLQDYIHPDDQKRVIEVIGKAVRTGTVFELEHRVRRVDGTLGWTFSRAVPVRGAAGEIVEWFGAASDITERKQAEEALRRSEKRFRRLVEVSSQIVWVTNAQGEPLEDSPSWRAFTGRPYEQWVSWNWLDVFHPDDRERLANAWRNSLTNVVPYLVEARMLDACGEYRHVLCQAAPILNTDGSVYEWVGMNTDMTDLRKSEARLQRFYESGMIGVLYYTLDGPITDANEKFLEMVGYTREDLQVGRVDWAKLTPPEYRPLDEHAISQLKAAGVDAPYEKELIRKDGSRAPVIIGAATFDDARHEGIAFVLDITERKQMEEELRKSRDELELRVRERTAELNKAMEALRAERQRFHDVLDVLPVYVTLLAPDYHVSFANKVFLQRFGESRDLRCFEHLFSRSEPCEVCDTYKVLETMQPHQWEWNGPDGHIYEVFDFPFTDTDGSTLILEMGIDITERKQAEEKLGSYMARLEQSNQALQDFASIASHDMKEPLRKVKAFGCRLADKCGPSLGDEGKDYLQRMLHAADRMQGLLDALLNYSRVSTKTEPFRPVDLSAVVKEVLLDLEVRIEKTGGEVQIHELPTVEADPTQMRQLFQNLIGNALKFHRQGERPLVKVDCSANGPGSYVITVEDNGIGFEEEHMDKIFAPFQRLHGRSSSYEGTGMGLAICKKIVERHGGSITARSKPGQGAAFVIIIPEKQH